VRTAVAAVLLIAATALAGCGDDDEAAGPIEQQAVEYTSGICSSFKLNELARAMGITPSRQRVANRVAERALLAAEGVHLTEVELGEVEPLSATDRRRLLVYLATTCKLKARDLRDRIQRAARKAQE
jgi:hypothetical protein